MRKPKCSLGYGGEVGKAPWHVMWLPHGYAPTRDDRMVCYFASPKDGSWDDYDIDYDTPPVIAAVIDAIEKFMAENPDAVIGERAWEGSENWPDLHSVIGC